MKTLYFPIVLRCPRPDQGVCDGFASCYALLLVLDYAKDLPVKFIDMDEIIGFYRAKARPDVQ